MEEQQIKIVFGTDIRRFAIPTQCDFTELELRIRNLYNFGQVNFVLKYQDEENELITFSSNTEFQFAMSLFRNKIFRIIVEKAAQQLSTIQKPLSNANQQPQVPATTTIKVEPTPTPTPVTYPVPQPTYSPPFDPRWRSQHPHEKRTHWDYQNTPKPTPFDGSKMQLEEKPLGKQGGRFIKHLTIEDDTVLPPNTPFLKAWRFRNESNKPWPDNCSLVFVGKKHGDILGAASDTIPVNNKNGPQPNEEINICVNLITPDKPGKYVGYWRLAEPSGKKFGQRVRVQVQVATEAYTNNTTQFFLNPTPMGNLNYALFPASNSSSPSLFSTPNATSQQQGQEQNKPGFSSFQFY